MIHKGSRSSIPPAEGLGSAAVFYWQEHTVHILINILIHRDRDRDTDTDTQAYSYTDIHISASLAEHVSFAFEVRLGF